MPVQPFPSPLRYPGGKLKVANYVKLLFVLNDLMDGHYAEPYAGGCSVALSLLFGQYASKIFINDIDKDIYDFWFTVLNDPDGLSKKIRDAKLDMDEWNSQRRFLDNKKDEHSQLERAFAAFYLNRTNRSGIIRGGVIGGKNQTGKWKIDARFNKDNLIQRIEKIARQRDQIEISNLDARIFLRDVVPTMDKRSLTYLDPPYYDKGQGLYTNAYDHDGHADVADDVAKLKSPWLVSYDNIEKIKELYTGHTSIEYNLYHSAANHVAKEEKDTEADATPSVESEAIFKEPIAEETAVGEDSPTEHVPKPRRKGKEIMFFSPGLILPEGITDPSAISVKKLHALSKECKEMRQLSLMF